MVYANESSPAAQAQHAEDLYLTSTVFNPAAYAGAYVAPTVVTNANLGGLTTPYSGTRIVTVAANRAGIDAYPEDAQNTEDLEQEVRVGAALAAGQYGIYKVGGPVGDYSASNYQSSYVDGLWLAEASKQTGIKWF